MVGSVDQLVRGAIVTGPLLPEPIEVLATIPMGSALKVIGRGLRTNQVHQPVLDADQVSQLLVSPKHAPFDGDAQRFRLGIEGHRLGLAYEYDPYFSLSIARIDPLPHQLEAVYEYFLKLPRIRFLLADDPGAGKTIMAGLLLKELKIRGLVKRTLIVTPANLTFQWQREMKDKFREEFDVVRGDVLRAQIRLRTPGRSMTRSSRRSRGSRASRTRRRASFAPTGTSIIVDEAHKMSPTFEDKTDARLPARRGALRAHRPLPADDGDAAQGRPRPLPALPHAPRQGRLRRHQEPPGGDEEEERAVLPAAREGGAGHVPRSRDGQSEEALHEARRPDRSLRSRRRRSSPSTRAHASTSRTSRSRRPAKTRPRHAPSGSRWRCFSGASHRACTPFAEAWNACASSRQRILEDPEKFRQAADRQGASRRLRRACRTRSSRRSSPTWRTSCVDLDPAQLRERDPGPDRADRPGTGAGAARGRVEAEQAPRGAEGVGHLRRPEDEAPRLHGAQGHARLPRRRREGQPPARASSSNGGSRSRRSTAA